MQATIVHCVRNGKIREVEFFWVTPKPSKPPGCGSRQAAGYWAAMSQENVEVVRGIYAALARRDNVSPFEVYAEDIVWDFSNARRGAVMSKPVYQGHEGVREAWRDMLTVFDEVKMDVEELIDAGDQVLAAVREREVGRASGAPVETVHLAVATLADGKVTQMRMFNDREQAFEAAGLRE